MNPRIELVRYHVFAALLSQVIHGDLFINNDGSQVVNSSEKQFLMDFQKNPAKLSPTGQILDYPGKVPPTTVVAGTAPEEVKSVIFEWLALYQAYRQPFTNVSTSPDVFKPLLESNFPATDLQVLQRKLGRKGKNATATTESYINGHELNYIIVSMNYGTCGMPDSDLTDVFCQRVMATSLAIVFNLPELPKDGVLNLSWSQLARIFSGVLKYWNDKNAVETFGENNAWYKSTRLGKVAATAADLLPITIAINKNPSGQAYYLTQALEDIARQSPTIVQWLTKSETIFSQSLKSIYPAAQYYEYTSTIEVLGGTLATPYRLCVVYYNDALQNGAPIAAIQYATEGDTYLQPSMQTMSGYAKFFTEGGSSDNPGDNKQTEEQQQQEEKRNPVYPLWAFYYIYLGGFSSTLAGLVQPTCRGAVNVMRFLRFVLTDPGVLASVRRHEWPYILPTGDQYAGLIPSLRQNMDLKTSSKDFVNMSMMLTCQDDPKSPVFPVWNLVKEEILLEQKMIAIAEGLLVAQMVAILLAVVLIVLLLAGCWFRSYFAIMQRIRNLEYKIESSDIFLLLRQNETIDKFKGVIASRRIVDYYIPRSYLHTLYFGRWKSYQVMLRPCSLNVHRMDKMMKRAVIEMIDYSRHDHIGSLYGICEVRNGRYLVSEFCPYGDLRSSIIAKDSQFTLNIKFSLAGDIADGMCFLHRKGILHENLRSCAVYIEADLSAKVGDWEYACLHRLQGSYFAQETRLARTLTLFEQTAFYPWLYWTAPEVLQSGMLGCPAVPTKAQDVYSSEHLEEILGDEWEGSFSSGHYQFLDALNP